MLTRITESDWYETLQIGLAAFAWLVVVNIQFNLVAGLIRFFVSSPYFRGYGEIAPIFAKNLTVPSFAACRSRTARHMKTGKYDFERKIIALHFVKKKRKSPLPISQEAWRTRCTSFISERRRRFTIVRQMAPLPSGLTAAMDYGE